jgi:PhzF family phenazine biosynthesis protein
MALPSKITQPKGKIEPLPDERASEADILDVLGITSNELAHFPIQNACTSRVKTLIPLKDVAVLDGLRPDYTRMEELCERIGSTGLYPYAQADRDRQIIDARQFPKSSGYPEDPATGIAAAALSFGLLANGMVEVSERPIIIRQGRAMKRPSEIRVRFQIEDGRPVGCWLGGPVRLEGATPGEVAAAFARASMRANAPV